ncbi:MAG: site-specific integrase [Acidobacteria bacterium]|nr:site-specific integrase [Acidobacteriota bacterium]
MSVRKICTAKGAGKGCPYGDHRCSHPWWFDVMYRGIRHRMPVNEYALQRGATEPVRTKQEAEKRWEPRFLADVVAGRDPRVPPAPADPAALTFGGCVDLYLKSHVPQLKGQKSAESALNILRTHLGELPLTMLERPEPIEDFRRALKDRKLATVNRYLARLRHLLGWAHARELIARTPFGRYSIVVSTKRESQRARRIYPAEELALLQACDTIDTAEHWHAGREMRPRIIAALDLGVRRGEMLALRNRDVDWTKHRAIIRGETAKSAKPRAVPFDPKGRLATILEGRRFLKPEKYVFGSATGEPVANFRTAWETLVLLAHGESSERDKRKGRVNTEALKRIDLRWHDLRHESACRWRERGLDLREIQLLLGHSSLLVTQRYLNVTDDELTDAMTAKLGWGKA